VADLGTIVAKLGLDPSQLLAGVNTAKSALISAGKAMGDLETKAVQAFRTLQASDLGKNVRQLAQDCAEAAERADDLRDGLNGAFRDSAPQVASFIEQIGTAKGVLSDDSLAAAAKTLQNLGAFSEASLTQVADAAVATGKSVEGLAEAFGRFNKFADAKSVLGYQKAIGASAEELRALGATIDDNDKLLVDNEERLNAAREALQKFSDTKFSGALDAVSDDSAKLSGEMELLRREVGAATFSIKENLDSALLPFVQGLRDASPEVKAVAGVTAELASGAGSAVPQIVAMASQLKILGVTVSATVGSLAAMVAIVAAAAAGFAIYINELNKTNAAEETFLQQQEKTARALAENKGLIGKSAEELKKMGKSSKDLVPILQGLQDQLQQARDVDPNSAATKGLEAKIKEFKKTKDDLARIDLTTKKANEPGKVEKSVKEQAAIDEKARKEKKAAEEKDKRERETAAEKARKETLDAALDEIKQKAAAREIDKAQEIAALQEVLKTAKATASEKRDIQQQIANLTGQIIDKEASDNKARSDKAKQQAEKDAEQLRGVKKAGFDQQIKDAELALKRLDEEEKRGADVTIKRQAELAKKVAAEKANIDLQAEADKAKTTSGDLKAKITKQATGDKNTVDQAAAAEADKISKERKDSELKDRQEELDFNLEIQQKKVDALKQLAEAGAVSSQQVKTALEQQLAIQLELIEAQKQAALAATTDPTKIAQANKRAEIQVAEAKAATRKEIEATTNALKAQQEQQRSATSLDLGGNQQSLEEFFKSQSGFLDITKPVATPAKDAKSIAEQQAILRSLGANSPLSQSATDAAKASIPFKAGDSASGGAGRGGGGGGGPQSIATTVNHNSVNGTSIDDPALGRKIEEIVQRVVKTDNFKRGNG
jgi:hypothetical protein